MPHVLLLLVLPLRPDSGSESESDSDSFKLCPLNELRKFWAAQSACQQVFRQIYSIQLLQEGCHGSSNGLAYWALYQSSTSTTIVVNLLVVVVHDYYCTNTTNSLDTFQHDLFRPSLHLFKFFRIVWLKRFLFKFCCHKPIFWVWPRDFGQSSLQNLWWRVTIRKISSIHEHL